ncbi:MAG: hypothetical protein ACLP1X_11660 [Polyangiaceae bacterium]|jgi:hypothetical protein
MPDDPEPDHARGWMFIEKLLREEDLARLDKTSDEEVNRQMRAAGIEPEHTPTADELIARALERAGKRKVAALPVQPKRSTWSVWLVAAAMGAVAIALVVEKKEVVAWFHHEPVQIGPDLEGEKPRPPTPQERAAALRQEAFGACGDRLWAKCERKLDEAKQLDPAGENDLQVQGARNAVKDGLTPQDLEGKPPGK